MSTNPTPIPTLAAKAAEEIHHFNIAMVDDRCTLPKDRLAAIITRTFEEGQFGQVGALELSPDRSSDGMPKGNSGADAPALSAIGGDEHDAGLNIRPGIVTPPARSEPSLGAAQRRLDELRTIAANRMWTQEEFAEACDCVTNGAAFNYPAPSTPPVAVTGTLNQIERIIAEGIANGDHPKTIAMRIVAPPPENPGQLRTLTPAGIVEWGKRSEDSLCCDPRKIGATARAEVDKWKQRADDIKHATEQTVEGLRARLSQAEALLRRVTHYDSHQLSIPVGSQMFADIRAHLAQTERKEDGV